MLRLVVVDQPPGPAWVDALRRAWDEGDAVFPLDHRLPRAAARPIVDAMRPDEPVEPGDALVVATSGTTGEPKGVVLTHDAVRASAEATSTRLGVDPSLDRWLACLPLAHVGGLAVVTRALLTGTPVEVLPSFDAASVEAAARDRGATLVSLVPTALGRIDPSRFRVVVVGGSAPPLTPPPNVVTTYGMTETGSGVVYDGEPLDGVDVRVSAESEIHVRGPMLLRAYRDGRDPKDSEGWLATGDIGRWDERDGARRLVVHGRRGELIVTGGENVWPAPIEAVLADHPGVAEVAVVGRTDSEWGQRIVAVVVPSNHSSPPTLEELRQWVKQRLAPWCAPRQLELRAALPRRGRGLGKVDRERL
jgi:o-succinylbenzoate---CoA ligase